MNNKEIVLCFLNESIENLKDEHNEESKQHLLYKIEAYEIALDYFTTRFS